MKVLLRLAPVVALMASLISSMVISAETVDNLDDLLKQVKNGRLVESRENLAREQKFQKNKNEQSAMLASLKKALAKEEAKSQQLEALFESNDKKIAEAEKRLRERMGSLGELFGHITSAAGDARSNFASSLVSINYPNRDQFLANLIKLTSSSSVLPSIAQIERLWFELQREMIEQGRIVKFDTELSRGEGKKVEPVVRVGTFNVISSKGEYLQFDKGRLSVLPRQPSASLTAEARELAALTTGYTRFGTDPTGPTGGSLLSALIDTPTLEERWEQGGIVGYVITAVGILALFLGLWRLLVLAGVGKKVKVQLKSDTLKNDNPLGRVLAAAEENNRNDTETMELKLNEAILKELPSLTKGEALLKIIAAVAPLLGLLGTVTGMIMTFQAITLFGAGDPKAMAGGISSALITTVLGLIVAIPTLLMHTLVSSRSKHVIHVLEEQAAGIVAQHQEKQHD